MAQLEQILVDCLALAAQDKITAKNSWSLQLLEHIDRLVSPDQESCDFVYISSAISASAKIYAGRVDSLHNMVRHTAALGCAQGKLGAEADGLEDTDLKASGRVGGRGKRAATKLMNRNTELSKPFSALQMKPAPSPALFRLDPLYSQLQIQELACTTSSLPVYSLFLRPSEPLITQDVANQMLAAVRPITSHMAQVAQASLLATPLAVPSGSLDRSYITVDPAMQSQYGNFSSRIDNAAHTSATPLLLSPTLEADINRYVENSDSLSITEDLISVSGAEKNLLWSAAKPPNPPKRARTARKAASTAGKKASIGGLPRAPRASRAPSSSNIAKARRKTPVEAVETTLSDHSMSLDANEPYFEAHQKPERPRRRSFSIVDLDDNPISIFEDAVSDPTSILNIVKTDKLLGLAPTKVNMHQLKLALHKEITTNTLLSEIVMPPRISCLPLNTDGNSTSAISLVFSALLHLASENCIKLASQQDDVTITFLPQGIRNH